MLRIKEYVRAESLSQAYQEYRQRTACLRGSECLCMKMYNTIRKENCWTIPSETRLYEGKLRAEFGSSYESLIYLAAGNSRQI